MTADGADVDAVEARAGKARIPSRGIGPRSAEQAGRRVPGVIISEWRIQRRPRALVPVILASSEETVELLLDPPEDGAAILFPAFVLIHRATVAVHGPSFTSKAPSTTFRTAAP